MKPEITNKQLAIKANKISVGKKIDTSTASRKQSTICVHGYPIFFGRPRARQIFLDKLWMS